MHLKLKSLAFCDFCYFFVSTKPENVRAQDRNSTHSLLRCRQGIQFSYLEC